MRQFLTVDIGAGTMDILVYDMDSGVHYKAVAKSPVLSVAEKAASTPGHLLITGVEMGGGSLSKVLRQRAEEGEITMSVSSAATIHHNPEKVRSWGINIVGDEEAETLRHNHKYTALKIGDLEPERLACIVEGIGLPFSFDVVGICAQDHGVPPDGISHLDFRHNIFKSILDENPFPHAMLHRRGEVPDTFNRLKSISESATLLPAKEIYVMDSGLHNITINVKIFCFVYIKFSQGMKGVC